MRIIRSILCIFMIISIIIAAGYTVYKIPSYLGFSVKRTILLPTDYDIEAVQEAMGISFPEGTEVKRITCSCSQVWLEPEECSLQVRIKLPQTDEGQQFIQSYYSIEQSTPQEIADNEQSYNKDGSFSIEFSTKEKSNEIIFAKLKKMSQPIKPIAGTLWMIAILFIILYRIVNKRYNRRHMS